MKVEIEEIGKEIISLRYVKPKNDNEVRFNQSLISILNHLEIKYKVEFNDGHIKYH